MRRGLVYLLVAFIHATTTWSIAQNLVPNNGFETNDGTPTGYGQWYHATGWSDVNDYPAFMWPYASPDYLHNTGAGGADLPVCTFGTVTPYAGNAVMGFITWLQSTPEFREYISITLSSPMIVGTPYNVSFWITNGSASWYNGYSSNRISARFSVGHLTQANHEPIGGTPQCELVTNLWTTTWQYVSFVYTPDAAYDQITIGNFYNDASTSHTYHVASMSAGSYYFIDEVVVEPVTPLPIELLSFNAEQQSSGVNLYWSTASEMDVAGFDIMHSADGFNFEKIGYSEAKGGLDMQADYQFMDDAPDAGLNYYQLLVINTDGSTDSSVLAAVWYTDQVSAPVVYPNPSVGDFTIAGLEADRFRALRISDLSGRVVMERIGGLSADHVEISGLNKGTYIVTVNYDTEVYNFIQIIE